MSGLNRSVHHTSLPASKILEISHRDARVSSYTLYLSPTVTIGIRSVEGTIQEIPYMQRA